MCSFLGQPTAAYALAATVLLTMVAGCAASKPTVRPEVETDRVEGSTDYSGLISGEYYTPLIEGRSPEQPPAGVRYVDESEYEGPTATGGQAAVRVALSRELAGFTCPVRGRVYVSGLVDASGALLAPRVTGSIHPECDARALRAFTSLQFSPARVQGQAVAMPLTLPVRFN